MRRKKIPDNTKYLMEKVVLDWIGSIETSKLLDLEDCICIDGMIQVIYFDKTWEF